ncbi:hypothetical protein OG897_13395 [Streptomyces sp. NBC_00237]|uniref:hypothetical protein n=1 Tax=Streptomyces sp. NBC_00237 TaxID=2975687 RepID=UPI002257C205|nr:hypothetical protein [Streptomyces sp. NBC_00237]MCX5202438.1 hypothetical protein [Streptomyces sp. NBC_00237]
MTRPSSPSARRIALDEATDRIVRLAYRGEPPTDVLARAVRMLATADGHLDAGGRLKRRERA